MKQQIPLGAYVYIKSTYIPLLEGDGAICDNCGRLIANIVTVNHTENGQNYTIGADCAKTILGKDEIKQIDVTISYEKRRANKIAGLDKAGCTYVVNEKGWPCHDPSTRHGFMIPY